MLNKIDYLLNVLSEECDEVGQRCCKAIRFGHDEVQPEQSLNNTERLVGELNDLLAVVEMLKEEGLKLKNLGSRTAIKRKKERVNKFMELSRAQGKLE